MAFKNRREFFFLYTVVDANPNGDPLNQNYPRYDEDTEQIMVSDVRIKRTIRDQWLREKRVIFVDGENKTIKQRYEELKSLTGKKNTRAVLEECLDVRLFGVTFAMENEAFAWTGPVQLKWGRSLHAVNIEFIQGSSAFVSRESRMQRSFRNEHKVPFALIYVYGIANQYAAEGTGASDNDLDAMVNALWQGTDNLISRSKNEHKSRLYIGVKYREGFNSKIGSPEEKICLLSRKGEQLNRDRQKALRGLKEIALNIEETITAFEQFGNDIKEVQVIKNRDLHLAGEDRLKSLPFCSFELR